MYKRKASRSTLFFIELLIVILLFALCAAVCLNLFVAADRMSNDSDDLNHAVLLTKTAAGCYKAADGDLTVWCRLMNASEYSVNNDTATIYYDAQWQQAAEAHTDGFYLRITSKPAPTSFGSFSLCEADIIVGQSNGEEIFALQVKKTVIHAGGALHDLQ